MTVTCLRLLLCPRVYRHTFTDGGPPPRPNLPHGVVLGVAPSGVIGYNCNYQNFAEPADGEEFDMQTCVHAPFSHGQTVTCRAVTL